MSGPLVARPATPSSAQVLSRFAVPVPRPALWVALWFLAAAAEFAALIPVIFGTEPILAIDVAYRLVGGTFAACGLIAWHRRPDSHVGLLMTLSGFGFLISPILGQFHFDGALSLAYMTGELYSFPWVALLLTLVTAGRLRRRLDIGLVVSFVIPLLLLQFVWLLFLEVDGNVLVLFPDAGIASAIDKVQRSTAGPCRWRWRSPRPGTAPASSPRPPGRAARRTGAAAAGSRTTPRARRRGAGAGGRR